jgi:uncharacterized membrane protein
MVIPTASLLGQRKPGKPEEREGQQKRNMNWHKQHKEKLTFGQQAADKLRNMMGSWPFVIGFLVFMLLWAFVNMDVLPQPFDNFPFILLNLFLSMLAGLQGAILLIAAKRQDEISAALAQHDYETNVRAKEEIETLQTELARIENEKLDKILALLSKKTSKKRAKRSNIH